MSQFSSKRLVGFEVVVFMSLFSIAALGNAKLVLNFNSNSGAKGQKKVATVLAQSKLKEISSFSYPDILKTTEGEVAIDSSGRVVPAETGDAYRRTIQVSQMRQAPLTEFSKVTVTVRWFNQYGVSTALSKSFIFSPPKSKSGVTPYQCRAGERKEIAALTS